MSNNNSSSRVVSVENFSDRVISIYETAHELLSYGMVKYEGTNEKVGKLKDSLGKLGLTVVGEDSKKFLKTNKEFLNYLGVSSIQEVYRVTDKSCLSWVDGFYAISKEDSPVYFVITEDSFIGNFNEVLFPMKCDDCYIIFKTSSTLLSMADLYDYLFDKIEDSLIKDCLTEFGKRATPSTIQKVKEQWLGILFGGKTTISKYALSIDGLVYDCLFAYQRELMSEVKRVSLTSKTSFLEKTKSGLPLREKPIWFVSSLPISKECSLVLLTRMSRQRGFYSYALEVQGRDITEEALSRRIGKNFTKHSLENAVSNLGGYVLNSFGLTVERDYTRFSTEDFAKFIEKKMLSEFKKRNKVLGRLRLK